MFKRLLRVIKAFFGSLIGKAENPKLLMGEIISEMQAQKVEAGVDTALAALKSRTGMAVEEEEEECEVAEVEADA